MPDRERGRDRAGQSFQQRLPVIEGPQRPFPRGDHPRREQPAGRNLQTGSLTDVQLGDAEQLFDAHPGHRIGIALGLAPGRGPLGHLAGDLPVDRALAGQQPGQVAHQILEGPAASRRHASRRTARCELIGRPPTVCWPLPCPLGHGRAVRTVVVTGVAGSLGQRVSARLAARADVDRVVGIDVVPPDVSDPKLDMRIVDLAFPRRARRRRRLDRRPRGGASVIHLAWRTPDSQRGASRGHARGAGITNRRALDRVLRAAAR